jgi:hypothetical protein
MPTPINLGPYLLNAPSETEKGHIRDSLDLGSASLLNGAFENDQVLRFTDPNNSTRTITLDKTLFGSAIADSLRRARAINVTGQVTTSSPIPLFDGTEDINIPITINDGAISESKLATDSVVASKIKDGEVIPSKLSAGGPSWAGGTTFLSPGLELGNNITADGNSFVDFHSSFPVVDNDARIWRRPGVNGNLDIINNGTGTINIRGLSIASDNTVTTSRQLIGGIEIIGNQINCTFGNPNAEIAINYENSDSTVANFLNTTVYNGKREVSARFFGDTKLLETYGPCRSITNGQIGWATAGLESRSATGNALVALHAAGSTATLLKHVRGGSGLEIRDAADTGFAPLKSAGITATDNIIINNTAPTLYLQDTDHRSAMVHVNSNIFYVLRGSAVNSTTWTAHNGRWPMELNLENNYATFGGGMRVNGNLDVTGDIIAYSTSDKSLKTNVKNIKDSLLKIDKINGVTFDWDASKQTTHVGSDVGVLAQEIEEVLPDAVVVREDGYKAVKYEKIIPLLIESIKDLKSLVESLQEKITKLEK